MAKSLKCYLLNPPHEDHMAVQIRCLGRILIDVRLSGLCFLLAMMLRLGLPDAFEDGQTLLINLLIFLSVCAAVYGPVGPFLALRLHVSTPDILFTMRDIIIGAQ